MRKKVTVAIFIFLILFTCQGLQADRAREIAAAMDDSSLAAQVLLTGIEGNLGLTENTSSLLERIPAGGVMLFRHNLNSPKDDVKKLLSEVYDLIEGGSGIAPFISVDHEGGLVHRFGPGVERLPSAHSFWELAQREGRVAAIIRAQGLYRGSAEEIRELGINMVLAPVVELLNDENRVFLATRSFGPDLHFNQAAASAYIRSMSTAGIASVIKHFPGNSSVDPHLGVAVLEADRATLDEMARPFAGIIRSLRPAALMLSHVMVPALDPGINASLSGVVIQDWLRGELGFQGIVMSDDYAMAAVTSRGISPSDAAVQALNAGVDMIMVWPRNIDAVHSAILGAIETGQLSRERLREAAGRIIAEKIRYGLI